MMKTLRNTLMVVAAASVLALPSFTSASDPYISVSYDAAELESVKGQERLYERMRKASRKLCGSNPLPFTSDLAKSIANEKCYTGTLTAVVNRLDHPAVTALHNKTAQPTKT